ncbi:MAG: hypothetical protein BGO98_05820 [Myxococcales bacterium 68-20]|nr:hypothetical protein [Myxococcales bacterium]OJY28588.1 MAG: hypothetical protein BGO98_05820 [Myxococcales bacterium 68-20]
MTKPWIVRKIAADPHARRELLWLRAREKDDIALASDLEEIDPGLLDRLRAAGVDLTERPGELPHERRERFGRLSDECYRRHELAVESTRRRHA